MTYVSLKKDNFTALLQIYHFCLKQLLVVVEREITRFVDLFA